MESIDILFQGVPNLTVVSRKDYWRKQNEDLSRFCRHYHLSQHSLESEAIMPLHQPLLKPNIKGGVCLAVLKTEWVTSKPVKCINVKSVECDALLKAQVGSQEIRFLPQLNS